MEMYLGRLALAYRAAMRARLDSSGEFSEWGLRPPSMGTLKVIDRSAPVSQREVGDYLGVHPSDMVRVIDQLEEYGLVARVRSEVDRRRYDLTLTPKGREVMDRFTEVAVQVDDEFYGVLTPTERLTFERLMSKVVEAHAPAPVRAPTTG